MANIIPMAGLGKRYSENGYLLPKPLISVAGESMINRVIRNTPKSDEWIFIVRKEHIENYKIHKIIGNENINATFITVDDTTKGQACSVLLAEPYLKPNKPVFIASCDNGYLFDNSGYTRLINNRSIDAIIWTFTEQCVLKQYPKEWGWAKIDDTKTITSISIKEPISNSPYYDHAIVSSFYLKKSRDLFNAINLMVQDKYKINNEYYLDALPIFLNKMHKKSVIFDVLLYVGWGSPRMLYEFQRLEYFYMNNIEPKPRTEEEKRILPLFSKYFEMILNERY